MLVYDDMNLNAPLTVYDKGAERLEPDGPGTRRYRLRDDAVHVPVLSTVEPLTQELRHFLDCVRTRARPRTDGWNGVRVVAVLEAADVSLRAGGATVTVPRVVPLPAADPLATTSPPTRPRPHPDGPAIDLTTATR